MSIFVIEIVGFFLLSEWPNGELNTGTYEIWLALLETWGGGLLGTLRPDIDELLNLANDFPYEFLVELDTTDLNLAKLEVWPRLDSVGFW